MLNQDSITLEDLALVLSKSMRKNEVNRIITEVKDSLLHKYKESLLTEMRNIVDLLYYSSSYEPGWIKLNNRFDWLNAELKKLRNKD